MQALLHAAWILAAVGAGSVPAPSITPPSTALAVQDEEPSPYERAADARDSEALAELWRAAPTAILPTFDRDLEGGLAAWEQDGGDAMPERTRTLFDRALFAAESATAATGRPIFADYASAFVGWNAEQRRDFRAGQKAFDEAVQASRGGQHEASLTAARRCRELAEPLGDWWGTAMGLGAEGRALLALERAEEALVHLSRARLLNAQLGLAGSELGNAIAMADACEALGRWRRGIAALDGALRLCGEDRAELREQLSARRDEFEQKLAGERTR